MERIPFYFIFIHIYVRLVPQILLLLICGHYYTCTCILTGKDTTTTFYGHWKKNTVQQRDSYRWCSAVAIWGRKKEPVKQNVIDDMSLFTIRYVYNAIVSTSLGEVRARKSNEEKINTSDSNPYLFSYPKGKTSKFSSLYIAELWQPDGPPYLTNNSWILKHERCVPERYTNPALRNS